MEPDREEFVDAIFQHLLETGAIVLKGMSADGEPVYSVTEKCKDVFPEYYDMHMASMNNIAYELWGLGIVEIVFEDENERVLFTDKNEIRLEEHKSSLTADQAEFLRSLGVPVN
jgi:hypothetical protein